MKKLLFVLSSILVWNLWAVTYTVTTTTDNAGDGTGTSGSLRYCVQQALSTAGPHTINFNLAGAAPFTINLTNGAFNLYQYDFTINATTQPGWAPAQNPVVILRGNGGGDAFQFNNSNRSTLRGFIFQNYQNGIVINNSVSGHIIENCWFGLNGAGTSKTGNTINDYGILIQSAATNVRIGSTTTLDNSTRCVISGCNKTGIYSNGAGANLTVSNCYVGTDATGSAIIGNGTTEPQNHHGIDLNNTGTNARILNCVISGNTGAGIEIRNTSNTVVQGNKIGTDVTGTVALGNRATGMRVRTSSGHTIGGTTAVQRNIISANGDPAITNGTSNATQYDWYNMCGIYMEEVSNSQISGNYIGTDVSGVASPLAMGNFYTGVKIVAWNNNGAEGNTVGGNTAAHGNIIGGNGHRGYAANTAFPGHGVQFQTNTLGYNENNSVLNNYIGIGADGTSNIGNRQDGVSLFGSVRNIYIGGNGTGNKIGWNAFGVFIQNNCQSNFILGNYIGTSASGTQIAPNSSGGICIQWGSTGNYVGRANTGEGNVISGNAGVPGVIFRSGGSPAGTGNNNFVYNNIIGLQPDGISTLPSTNSDGVYILGGSTGNTIGGTAANQRNIISGNLQNGIHLDNGDNTIIRNNYIGIDAAGAAKGNMNNGIFIEGGSTGNGIGSSGGGNIISGNTNNGIFINGATNTSNTIRGNKIGTNIAGTAKISNGINGIWIIGVTAASTATATYIGGTTPLEGNVISGNALCGIKLDACPFTRVHGNIIGTDTLGASDLGNGSHGLDIFNASNASEAIGNIISGNGDAAVDNLGNGISVTGTNNLIIQANLVGVNRTGTAAISNFDAGFSCTNSNNSTIGGTALQRNIISGNGDIGMYMNNSDNNSIQNNYIGVGITGNSDLGNGTFGLYITTGCTGNTVASNVIAGNGTAATDHGVVVDASASNTFSSNNIGVGADNTTDLGHLANGIHVQNGSADNILGAGNRIGYNNGNGIEIDGATSIHNSIHNNSIFCNGNRGIVLSNGGNNSYAAPTITDAGGGNITVTGPGGSYIEVYELDGCNDCSIPNNNKLQGRTLVFSGASPYTFAAAGSTMYTATASEASSLTAHNTSEFSSCYVLCVTAVSPTNIAVSPARNVCASSTGPITLTASGAGSATYEWFEGSCNNGTVVHTGATYTLASTPSATTHYFVRAVTGCSSSQCLEDSIVIHQAPVAVDSVSSPTFCANATGTITLTTTGGTANGATLVWYTGSCGGTQVHTGATYAIPMPSSNIDYFVRYESLYCGNTTCEQGTVTINQVPSTGIAVSPARNVCASSTGPITLTASGTGATTYEWFEGSCNNGTVIHTGATLTLSAVPSATTHYFARPVSVCSNAPCVEDSVVIHQAPVAVDSVSSPTLCANAGTITLTTTGGAANGATLVWYTGSCGGTQVHTGSSYVIPTPSSNIDYFVRYESLYCGNTTCEQGTIVVNPVPSASINGTTTFCEDSTNTFSTTGTPQSTYVWSFAPSAGTNIANQGTNSIDLTLDDQDGVLSLTETIAGCSTTVSVTITSVQSAGDTAYVGADRHSCVAATRLNANDVNGTWTSIGGTVAFSPDANTYNATVSGLSNGLNQLIWTVTGACGYSDADTVDITVGPSSLVADASAPSDTQCVGAPRTISANITADGSGDYTYIWTSSDNSVNYQGPDANISITTGAGLVELYLTIMDNQETGCMIQDTASIYTVGDQELVIPNLITPNEDGKNDYFELKDLTDLSILPGSYLEVTNRWGQYVYKDKSYGNTWKGENASDGVYYYYLQTGCGNRAYKGWVQVIR